MRGLWAWRILWVLVTVVMLISTCVRSVGIERIRRSPRTAQLDRDLVVVSWNVHKGGSAGFLTELETLVRTNDADLLLLQEARPDLIRAEGFAGAFAGSWRSPLSGLVTGVATYASAKSLRAEAVNSDGREVYLTTRKVSLITEYPVQDRPSLLVANVHGLNFDPVGSLLSSQLSEVERRLARHDGPMILAGDFNTWSRRRLDIVRGVADRLGMLEAVADNNGGRTADSAFLTPLAPLGLDDTLVLDRLFYRGMTLRSCRWDGECRSSDHSPLIARLRVN